MTDKRGLTYPFIGPTRTQAKEIVWEDHVANVLKLCKDAKIPYKKNEQELSIRFPGYGKVVIDGGDNIESLRGKSDWGGVVLDEFRYWKNQQYAWDSVIRPNLIPHKAWVIVSSTPQGYDFFHYLMKLGDHNKQIEGDAFDYQGKIAQPNKRYISFRYDSFANPHIDREWLEDEKQTLSETAFNQEILARFEKFVGVVYKEFDRKVHVIEPFKIPIGWELYGAMDFGAVNPTVYLWIAVDRDYNIYVFDEYFQKGQTTEFHANVIKAKTQSLPITATWGDPSAEQETMDFGNQGVYITPAVRVFDGQNPSWVKAGINRVSRLLKVSPQTGKPKLFIFNNCSNLIREFESYRWLEQSDKTLNEKEIPLKTEDHGMDALRYFVVSYFASLDIANPNIL